MLCSTNCPLTRNRTIPRRELASRSVRPNVEEAVESVPLWARDHSYRRDGASRCPTPAAKACLTNSLRQHSPTPAERILAARTRVATAEFRAAVGVWNV